MTLSELDRWRKYVPVAIFGACALPWFLVRSGSLADADLANKLIVPVVALVAAYFYVGSGLSKWLWNRENERHVGKQIRDFLLGLIPRDLAISDKERNELRGQVYKTLSGVFGDAIDGNGALKALKERFYSNGIVYSTSLDVYVICSLVGSFYIVMSLLFAEIRFAYVSAGLIAIALASRWIVTPRTRSRHMQRSLEQLELLRRVRGDFVSERFREIVSAWRDQRATG
jgi:hypothetical protein